MMHKHPAVLRAAALKAKFYLGAPQPSQITEVAPASPLSTAQLEARADDLRQSIIRYEAQLKDPTLNREPNSTDRLEALIDEADEEIAAIEAQLEMLEAPAPATVPSFTVTTQPHPSHKVRHAATIRNFSDRAEAESYAEFFGRSTIVARPIVPCAECGGHGCDGPKRIPWTNPNAIAMRCGRCGGDGEEPELPDTDEERYPDNDPSL